MIADDVAKQEFVEMVEALPDQYRSAFANLMQVLVDYQHMPLPIRRRYIKAMYAILEHMEETASVECLQ